MHTEAARLSDLSRTLYAWCAARVNHAEDAQDLSQEILTEFLRSKNRLQDESAWYGFFWSLAGNVLSRYYRRKTERQECALPENLPDASNVELSAEQSQDLSLLRRELTLLHTRHRKATVYYYVDGLSCARIAEKMDITESMVKYLLFHSRKLLKEGMTMERNYGQQSYSPRRLELHFWGQALTEEYYGKPLTLAQQNILFACYYSPLSPQEISLETGIPLPYLEEDIEKLTEYDLLVRTGARYSANLILFTDLLQQEAKQKTADFYENFTRDLISFVESLADSACELGLANFSRNTLYWLVTCHLLRICILDKLEPALQVDLPLTRSGQHCLIWGVQNEENKPNPYGVGVATFGNPEKDHILFTDYPVNGPMIHHFFTMPATDEILLRIARNGARPTGEYEQQVAAQLIREGFVCADGESLRVNLPQLTRTQFDTMRNLLEPAANTLFVQLKSLCEPFATLIRNHAPTHLKKQSLSLVYPLLMETAMGTPIRLLCESHQLLPAAPGEFPTTLVVLQD